MQALTGTPESPLVQISLPNLDRDVAEFRALSGPSSVSLEIISSAWAIGAVVVMKAIMRLAVLSASI
jgi:hypothetical protein